MPTAPIGSNSDLAPQIEAHLRAGDYRAAARVAETLAAALESAETGSAPGSAWVAVCRARREMGLFAEAEAAGLRALAALAAAGREHPDYATGVRELARTYEELGRYTQAEALDRQALAIRRRALGDHHADTAQSLSDLSAVLGWLDKFAECDACGAEAVAVFARPENARHPGRPMALANWSFALTCAGNNRESVAKATEAHQLAEQLFPAKHPERATIAALLARRLLVGIRTDRAEQLLNGALEIRRAALGEEHPHCAGLLAVLSGVRRAQVRGADAEKMLNDSLRIARAAHGEDHTRTADAYERLAGIFADRAEYEDAERLSRKAIGIYSLTLGADNTATLDTELGLAAVLALSGRAEDAAEVARGVIARVPAGYPTGLSAAHDALARALGEQGALTEALPESETALRILRGLPGVAPSWLAYALTGLSWYQLETGAVAAGVASAKEAFDITAADAGRDHSATLTAARDLANAYLKQGEPRLAEQLLRRAMADAPRTVPPVDLRTDLARALAAQGGVEQAEELHLRLVAERRTRRNEEGALADALLELGFFYEECGNLGAALPRYREALDLRRAAEGPDGVGVARALHTIAALEHSAGRGADALRSYEQALAVYRTSRGEDSAEYAVCEHALARFQLDTGDAERAEATARKAIEKLAPRGARNAEHLAARQTLALILAATGKFPEARETLLSVLETNCASVGPKHPVTNDTRSQLANVYLAEGDVLAAEPLIREVAARNRELFPGSPALVLDDSRLAQVYARFGEYEPARLHVDRYLSAVRGGGGENSPAHAYGLMLMADVHLLRDDYPAALRATHEALAIRRRAVGESHPLVADALQRLAQLEFDLGKWNETRAHAAEATAIVRRIAGPDSPAFAGALRAEAAANSIAAPDAAGEFLRRAVALERRCYGDNSPLRVPGILECADWHLRRREYPPAEELLVEAARVLQHSTLEENLMHVGVASRLATVMMRTKREPAAGRHLHQAFDIAVRMFGHEHPDVTVGARRIAWWHVTQGARADALATLEGAQPGEDAWAEIACDTAFAFDRFRSASDALLTDRFRLALLASETGADLEPVYARLVRDRAREAALVAGPPLAREPVGAPDRADRLTRCRRLRVQLAETTLMGSGYEKPEAHRARIARWREEERRIAAEFPSAPAVGVGELAAALPPGGTLVEFVRVIEDFDREDKSRYVAIVLRAGAAGELKLIDLGAAAEIDRLAGEWSAALAQGTAAREGPAGAKVAALLLAPLLPHLGNGSELFVVPDTNLRAVPFAALPVPEGERVADRFAVTLLTTATALLGAPVVPHNLRPLVVTPPGGGGLFGWLRWMVTGRANGGAALATSLGVQPRLAAGTWLRDTVASAVYVAVPGALQADPPFGTDKPAPRFLDPLLRYGAKWNDVHASAVNLRGANLTPGAAVVLPQTVPVPGPAGAEALTWVARAFRHAGASATVVGLWSVPFADDLWLAFQNALKDGAAPAAALREAQLRAKRQNAPVSQWGAFACFAG